jgi:hypothetical protein
MTPYNKAITVFVFGYCAGALLDMLSIIEHPAYFFSLGLLLGVCTTAMVVNSTK